MACRDLTFRVFVSSMFSDLITERSALQRSVFPRLREYCQQKGAWFQAIDLRWGVSEEASLDQQTMNICLEVLAPQATSVADLAEVVVTDQPIPLVRCSDDDQPVLPDSRSFPSVQPLAKLAWPLFGHPTARFTKRHQN